MAGRRPTVGTSYIPEGIVVDAKEQGFLELNPNAHKLWYVPLAHRVRVYVWFPCAWSFTPRNQRLATTRANKHAACQHKTVPVAYVSHDVGRVQDASHLLLKSLLRARMSYLHQELTSQKRRAFACSCEKPMCTDTGNSSPHASLLTYRTPRLLLRGPLPTGQDPVPSPAVV